MLKKIICAVMSVLMLMGTMVQASERSDLPVGLYNILYQNRYLFFATDGGSFIKRLDLPKGTEVDLGGYVPEKDGYIFKGWYIDPKSDSEKVSEVTLNENTVVWAKWEQIPGKFKKNEEQVVESREIVGNTVVIQTQTATLTTSVSDLWLERNARLESLMKLYNEKFNN